MLVAATVKSGPGAVARVDGGKNMVEAAGCRGTLVAVAWDLMREERTRALPAMAAGTSVRCGA